MSQMFPSPLGEQGKSTILWAFDGRWIRVKFPSPLGEQGKSTDMDTGEVLFSEENLVSVPSRGTGKINCF